MTSHEDKVKSTLERGEKVGEELFTIAPKDALEITLLNLTMIQLKLVLILTLKESARMTVIAEELNMGLSTVTGVIDRLVKLEIVAREDDPEDRRIVVCRLTEKGRSMVTNAWNGIRNRLAELLMEIPEEKLPLVDEVMDLFLSAGRSVRHKALKNQTTHSI
jgi:DNA-binding MarR family transcriptional regulator